jgi:hypothetical protein
MKGPSNDFKIEVMLQNSMGLIKDEPDSGSEAYETNLEDGIEEGNIEVEDADLKMEECDIKIEESEIKFEDSEDIKEENSEAMTIPPIKPEPEVSVWGLCIRQQRFMLPRLFTASKRKIMKIHFSYPYVFTLHFV